MKGKRVGWVLVALVICHFCQGQYYRFRQYYEPDLLYEIGTGMGSMHALTDLGGRPGRGKSFIGDLNLVHARPCVSLYLLALFRQAAGLKLEYTRGAVYGADEVLGGKGGSAFGRLERNLGFRSRIREMHLGAEIFPVVLCRNGYVDPPAAGPYLSCGMGYYEFSPETMWNGQWHALHPLRTEGQGFAEYPGRKMYALAQFNVGGGAGMRWRVSEILALRLEICYRFLWTDYLDDVSSTYVDPKLFDKYLPPERAMLARQLYSRKKERDPAAVTTPGDQRGNPGNRDSYFTILIKTGFIPARKRK